MKAVELRRHTANEGDVLTPEGVAAALEIGRRLPGDYQLGVSSGAQRATQTLACFLAGLGQRLSGGVIVEPALRSDVEARWREAYQKAGAGDLDSLRGADPELVEEDSARLAVGLRAIFDALPGGGRALAVGHSPTNEAAVFGLTGVVIAPLGKGEGVLVRETNGAFTVEPVPGFDPP
ncbi:MAG: histidine phosphatase family protein [Acidimicrobiia bacterium]|nr:histidine phosphatase family protein [Acidimicrobiia bacterium]